MTVRNNETDRLCEAFLVLEDVEECFSFLEDVCTIKELHAIAQRLEVAWLLKEKKTFSDIVELTGASTATISRVNRCLMYGSGGYENVLGKLENNEEESNENSFKS